MPVDDNQDDDFFIDKLFGFCNILRILANTEEFEIWLGGKQKKDTFHGYQFILKSIYRFILKILAQNDFLFLNQESSVAFKRGVSLQVAQSIEDLPSICERSSFIRKLYYQGRKLDKAKTFEELKEAIVNINSINNVFIDYFNNSIQTHKNYSKDDCLNSLSIYYIFIYLNDTRDGTPWVWSWLEGFRFNISDTYLSKVFNGYILTLNYLWNKLLGVKYANSIISDSMNIIAKRYLGKQNRWSKLDSYFHKINKELIHPIELKYKGIGFKQLFFITGIKEIRIEDFFDYINIEIEEPSYLTKTDKESLYKRLDMFLLWYPFDVFDSHTGTVTFNDLPAFVTTLMGAKEIRKANNDVVSVRMFQIPAHKDSTEQNHISMAILIGAFGMFDYSGWIIFHDFATDYSGTGSSYLNTAIEYLTKIRREVKLDFEKIQIERSILSEYFKERNKTFSIYYKKSKESDSKLDPITAENNSLKGKLFEYIAFKWLHDNKKHLRINCDVVLLGEQIDILGIDKKSISVYECKLNIHEDDIEKIINQLNRKMKIRRKYIVKDIKKILLVFEKVSPKRKKKLNKKGISVIDNFIQIIRKGKIFNGIRKDINFLLKSKKKEENEIDFIWDIIKDAD